jgi:DNA-binding beta-propeller fold protein YncE
MLAAAVTAAAAIAATPESLRGLMYVGTIDQKILVVKEENGEIVAEIPLSGIPRSTARSADGLKIHVVTTKLVVDTVDLVSRKVISSFPLSVPDSKSNPRMLRGSGGGGFSGIAVDPSGRYLYTSVQPVVKDLDQYRTDPPQFVMIDLQEKKIAKTMAFPKGYDQGFGFLASYKISPDGKMLYVFDDDIVAFDLATMKEIDRIPLARPEYPGASPYRMTASDEPNVDPMVVTSVFVSADPIVHKETIGIANLNLATRKVDYTPVGPAFPMIGGLMLTPDRKMGYTLMVTRAGANRETEWWAWDIAQKKVIRKSPVQPRPNFRTAISGDGKYLYTYGSGSSLEVYEAATLQFKRVIDLKKDTTTGYITLTHD